MKHLLIIGARGFGREVFRTFIQTPDFISKEIDVKGFLDDKKDALDGLAGDWPPIVSSVEDYKIQPDDVFFCALGDSKWRKHYSDLITAKGGNFISIIDIHAIIDPSAVIGKGCIIGQFSCIGPNVSIGNQTIIRSFCVFGHDACVGNYSSIESYSFLGGYAKVGDMSTMHVKSSIIRLKSIGNDCIVGAGSIVTRNIKDGIHVFGNPAQKINIK